MASIPPGSVDCIVADPPYGIDYQSARRTDKELWKPKIANDKEPYVEWIKPAYNLLPEGGVLFCFFRWDVSYVFQETIKNCGFDLKSEIIWDKVVHGMGDLEGAFAPRHESIFFATKGKFYFPGVRPQSIIRQKRVDAEKLIHPNEKPVPLIESLIRSVGARKVFDPFMGSGATGVASMRLGCDFVGCDIDKMYFDISQKRIDRAAMSPGLFSENTPAFSEQAALL